MDSVSAIRVMVVDDHPLIIYGLKFSIQTSPDLDLVGQASSGREALRLCAEYRPDVILVDVMMPDMDGFDTTRAIHKSYPQIKIMMLSALQTGEMVQRAIQAGAIGYLLKDITPAGLIAAIRLAYTGQTILSPVAIQVLLRRPPSKPDFNLSYREQEVLTLLVAGQRNEQIAIRLVISLSTVRFHVTNIFAKLGAANRAEASALAVKHHLVS